MTATFVSPWTLSGNGETIEIDGERKTFHEIRQTVYENIVDEALFIARASEGAISVEWIMSQPIFIRKKYVESFNKELKEREARMNRNPKGKR